MENYYANNQGTLLQYGCFITDKAFPTVNVLEQTGRPECVPRNIDQIVEQLDWSDIDKLQFKQLINGLIEYDPEKRWDCHQVLLSKFLE